MEYEYFKNSFNHKSRILNFIFQAVSVFVINIMDVLH